MRAKLPEAMRPAVTFLSLTGWRLGEMLALEWRQVDRTARTIRLEPGTTKNAEGRTFPYDGLPALRDVIDERAREAARLKREGRICPFVFHEDGRPWIEGGRASRGVGPGGVGAPQGARGAGALRPAGMAATTAAGCPGRLVHDFRRTAVRNLVRAGVPEKTAMMLTGHRTRSVFDRYDIVNEADLRGAVARLAGRSAPLSAER